MKQELWRGQEGRKRSDEQKRNEKKKEEAKSERETAWLIIYHALYSLFYTRELI